jgi:hypothetical protein
MPPTPPLATAPRPPPRGLAVGAAAHGPRRSGRGGRERVAEPTTRRSPPPRRPRWATPRRSRRPDRCADAQPAPAPSPPAPTAAGLVEVAIRWSLGLHRRKPVLAARRSGAARSRLARAFPTLRVPGHGRRPAHSCHIPCHVGADSDLVATTAPGQTWSRRSDSNRRPTAYKAVALCSPWPRPATAVTSPTTSISPVRLGSRCFAPHLMPRRRCSNPSRTVGVIAATSTGRSPGLRIKERSFVILPPLL